MAQSHEDSSIREPLRISGSRRTRSQGAPDWSFMDSLILVNEIAAVEADCLKALSSYQKWMIIAENCTAQDVPRNFNQCRRKWDFLLLDYNKIKKWESKSRGTSFWSMGSDRRESLGLPRDFDDELFLAIENLIMVRENQPDTDPDSDGEAKDDMVDVVKELGSKRQRRRLTSLENSSWKSVSEEISIKSQAERKPPKFHVEDVRSSPEVKPLDQTSTKRKPQKGNVVENESHETTEAEHKEQRFALILRENAEMVKTIVSQNAQYEVVQVENDEFDQTKSAEFVRRQGDKLIACLGDIVKSLDHLCDLVQECE
ncbi:trihelix transcription factor ASR3 isoform X2 [Humulus lupulus]|uniref:trihelix transcription factor ASR3 isoform X2 n=1 Tax=Humulus lupulus TaxID=3486 RepID=UPI002B40F3F4|nr:trihelix transcription factor ASR3 isoform X2 [Humulus lupulus]